MRERPILMMDSMVAAILDGRKDVTRRVGPTWAKVQPGTRLWVREASADVHPLAVQPGRFSIEGRAGIPGPPPVAYRRVYRADGDVLQVWHTSKGYPYRTLDGPEDEVAAAHPSVCSEWVGRLKYQPWVPSIHMPRWASRLTLEVVSVTEEVPSTWSAGSAPGAAWVTSMPSVDEAEARREGFAFRAEFLAAWRSMHADYTGPVYRIEFRRVEVAP